MGFFKITQGNQKFSGHSPNDFSLIRSISNARIVNEWEDGKYVVNTSRVETAWLHYPGIQQTRMTMYNIPDQLNIMVHLRNWTMLAGAITDEDLIFNVKKIFILFSQIYF